MDQEGPDSTAPPSGGARRAVPPPPFDVGGRAHVDPAEARPAPRGERPVPSGDAPVSDTAPAAPESQAADHRTDDVEPLADAGTAGPRGDEPADDAPAEGAPSAEPAPDPSEAASPWLPESPTADGAAGEIDEAAVAEVSGSPWRRPPEPGPSAPGQAPTPWPAFESAIVPPLATELPPPDAPRPPAPSPAATGGSTPPAVDGTTPSAATGGTPPTPPDGPVDGGGNDDDGWEESGPLISGRRRHRRTRVVLAGALALVFLVVSSAGALLLYGRGSIERADILGIAALDRVPLLLPDGEEVEIMNILLIGSDDRDNLSADQREQITLEDRSIGRRPDTIMLAQLELGGKGAALLSFPRDLRVELCDGSTDKINAAFAAGSRSGVGGESCLVQTVTNHTGIEIHHYAEVDFAGFLKVVDILGGVTMYLDKPMIDSKASLNVPAGCVTLTPEQALGFVRSRGYDDDFGRIARQQRFVKEVVEELTRVGVIANPAKVVSLVDAGANAVTTDREFGLAVMRDVALGARKLTADRLITHTVPADTARIDGISYVVERPEEAKPLYASFVDATVLRPQEPEPEPTPEPVVVPPLVVLNSTGTAGLAAVAAEVLVELGYEVAEVGNAEVRDLPATEVVHGPGQADAAAEVAAALGAASVREADDVDGVQVILGTDADADALRDLLVEAEPEPEPTPTPTPTPTPERTFRGADPGDVDC
jgi:LCP family protein required for cell wall assembly